MATVDRKVGSLPIQKYIAKMPETKDGLRLRATTIGRSARAELLAHRLEGHAFIEVTKGKIDYYVTLNDTNGLDAAMTIEYGRDGRGKFDKNGRELNSSQGLFILHNASGAGVKQGPKLGPFRRKKGDNGRG